MVGCLGCWLVRREELGLEPNRRSFIGFLEAIHNMMFWDSSSALVVIYEYNMLFTEEFAELATVFLGHDSL